MASALSSAEILLIRSRLDQLDGRAGQLRSGITTISAGLISVSTVLIAGVVRDARLSFQGFVLCLVPLLLFSISIVLVFAHEDYREPDMAREEGLFRGTDKDIARQLGAELARQYEEGKSKLASLERKVAVAFGLGVISPIPWAAVLL